MGLDKLDKFYICLGIILLVLLSWGVYYEYHEPGLICDEIGYERLGTRTGSIITCYGNTFEDDGYTIKDIRIKTIDVKAYKESLS